MVDPSVMCRKHLFGEHLELHMFAGSMAKKMNIDGYVRNNLVEPKSIKKRHDQLVNEMRVRGYQSGIDHQSPLEQPDISYLPLEIQNAKVDVESSLNDLMGRCSLCSSRSCKQ